MARMNISVVLILGVLSVYEAAPDVGKREDLFKTNGTNICKTPECERAALTIQSYIDPNVNPCDDFYKFACGGYVNTTESRAHLLTKVQQKIHKQIKTELEGGFTEEHPQAFLLMKSYYDTCMDTDQIESTAEREFLDVLEYLGGWPILEGPSWNESNFEWTEVIHKARKLGYSANYFFTFDIVTDPDNSSSRIIEIGPPTGAHIYYLKEGIEHETTKAYYKYMTRVGEILGGNWTEVKSQLNQSLFLEIGFHEEEKKTEYSYTLPNVMTIRELEENYPSIPWTKYFNEFLAPHANVQTDETIRVTSLQYFERLSRLLYEHPKRVLANYILWRVTMESILFLTEKLQEARNELLNPLYGPAETDRSSTCLSLVLKHFEIAVSSLYVREYFDESVRSEVMDILENVREGFKHIFSKAEWIKTEKDRAAFLEKIKKISSHVAYPQEILDDQKLDNYYKDLVITSESHLKSSLNLSIFSNEMLSRHLRERIDVKDWKTHTKSATVNAFYNKYENSIMIPAGILQEDFFSASRPNYLNYGMLGNILGHEMSHGFDSAGIRYGGDGEYESWWPHMIWPTKWSHVQILRCLKFQTKDYTVGQVNLKIKEIPTLDENIADNIGLIQAYKAYVNWEEKNGVEPQLPGLPYTARQMFWISSATTWCTRQTDEDLRNMIYTDSHAPSEFRVNGPRANMDEFIQDFNCPVESKMNRPQKCQYW